MGPGPEPLVRWQDLEPGDVMIDAELLGNDHAIVSRDGLHGIWVRLEDGEVRYDNETYFDELEIEGWVVWRGGKLVWPPEGA